MQKSNSALRQKPRRFGGSPIHPGVILRKDYLVPLSLSARALAKALRIPQSCLGLILAGRRAITADTALRLARYFGTTSALWVNLQFIHDVRVAELKR